jgi:hypothetical protein
VVDLIPIKKKFKYVSLQRQDLPEGRRYVYGDQKLPSVTTILSATKKDKGALDAWVKRVGQEEADRIKNEASRVGTYLHEVIERMVAYRDLPRPTNWDRAHGCLSRPTSPDQLGNVQGLRNGVQDNQHVLSQRE